MAQPGGDAPAGALQDVVEYMDVDGDEDEWEEEEFEEEDEDDLDGDVELQSADEEDEEEEDNWLSEDSAGDGDYGLSVKQRVALECGVRAHDASFFRDDAPLRHAGVASSTSHHQTADAIAFLPQPPAAPGARAAARAAAARARGVLGSEEVLVSHRGSLAIWQLAEDQAPRLMARAATCFRHFSIATSPCGRFVAASGNAGLVVLLRVVRSAPAKAPPAAAAAADAASAAARPAAAAAAAAAGAAGSEPDEAAAAPWQLLHEATLLCTNSRETMVNSVRFGLFAGAIRLLVSHQDGNLLLLNLPGEAPPGQASGGSGASASASVASDGSELMTRDLPDWEPLGSQVNRLAAEQLLSLLPASQAAAQAAADAGPEALQAWRQARRAEVMLQGHAASQFARAEPLSAPACRGAPGSLQQLQTALASGERLLTYLVPCLAGSATPAGCVPPPVAAEGSEALAELAPWFDGRRQPQHAACSWGERARHVAQLLQDEVALKVLRELAALRLAAPDPDSDPYERMHVRELFEVQRLSDVVEGLRLAAAGQWDLLGLAQPPQQQPQQQQEEELWRRQWRAAGEAQWARQAAEGDDGGSSAGQGSGSSSGGGSGSSSGGGSGSSAARDAALGRAVYCLLLLRLLAPNSTPLMKQDARLVILRHGPGVDPSQRVTTAELRGRPRRLTCAISRIAPDLHAQRTAELARQMAMDAADAAAAPGAPPGLLAEAAVTAHDAQIAAAAQQHLPINICEPSPDGRWLAVGVDMAAVLLLPAGPGYQRQAAQVLDLLPGAGARECAGQQQQGTLGCQYLAFNSGASLLAASSDYLKLVTVFAVGRGAGQRLACFSLHSRPVLPLSFVPRLGGGVPHDDHEPPVERCGAAHSAAAPATAAAAAAAAAATAAAAAAAPAACGAGSGSDLAALMAGWGAGSGDPAVGSGSGSGDRSLVWCEESGGLHIADMSLFLHLSDAQLLADCEAACTMQQPWEAQVHMRSERFCLAAYLEVPAALALGGGAVVAPAPAAPAAAQAQAEPHAQQAQEQAAPLQAQAGAAAGEPAPAPVPGQRINGLAVTPAGRALVACQSELLEWRLLLRWSREWHSRFPAAFRRAVRLLLLGAHQRPRPPAAGAPAAAAGGGADAHAQAGAGAGAGQLLPALPGVVLEAVLGAAAVPQAVWAAAPLPTPAQLKAALEARPGGSGQAGIAAMNEMAQHLAAQPAMWGNAAGLAQMLPLLQQVPAAAVAAMVQGMEAMVGAPWLAGQQPQGPPAPPGPPGQQQ